MNIQKYLERIHYRGTYEPTWQTLRNLHEAHLLAVPFENLDIHQGKEIVLDEASLWIKIVEHQRGGFCYELNGLFALLLRALGFQVDVLSAGVAHATGGFGPEFDHLALLVHLEEDWLADVGFGEAFRQPLRMQADLVQPQDRGSYRLERAGASWIYQKWDAQSRAPSSQHGKHEDASRLYREWDGIWKPAYRFTLQPQTLENFAEMCRYQQTSPAAYFTQKRVCSLATPTGRITLSDQSLLTTIEGEQTERLLTDEQYQTILASQFGIVLSPKAP